jgi:hypothetical protein
VPSTVVKGVEEQGSAPGRRDGGDGVTRDETGWTWWTPPLATARCLGPEVGQLYSSTNRLAQLPPPSPPRQPSPLDRLTASHSGG